MTTASDYYVTSAYGRDARPVRWLERGGKLQLPINNRHSAPVLNSRIDLRVRPSRVGLWSPSEMDLRYPPVCKEKKYVVTATAPSDCGGLKSMQEMFAAQLAFQLTFSPFA